MFVPDVCVHCEAVWEETLFNVNALLLSFSERRRQLGSKVESAALMRVAACHVTVVTRGDGGRGQRMADGTGLESSGFGGD